MGAHNAGKGTLIGQSQRFVAQRGCLMDKFFGMRGTTQKREITDGVKFCVTSHAHGTSNSGH